jgi:hypothetical protein
MPLPRGEVVSDEDFCGLAVVSLDVWARMLAEGPTEGAERSRHICQLCAQLLGVTGAAAAVALLHLGTGYGNSFADDTDGRAAYQMQVHQASGMVKIQAGVTIDEAFLMLRAHAFAAGRPVADVAKDVVERRLRFPVEDG